MDKRATRRECFQRIKALSTQEKSEFSSAIVEHVKGWPVFQQSKTIFSFLSLPSEPDLTSLVEASPDRVWAFSRVDEADRIRFHIVSTASDLVEGGFGFLEPNPELCPEIESRHADLILIPGVGFDPNKNARLGRGKGHYDRFLSSALEDNPSLQRVGVCFSTQLTNLEPEAHDIPMTGIVTEHGWETS